MSFLDVKALYPNGRVMDTKTTNELLDEITCLTAECERLRGENAKLQSVQDAILVAADKRIDILCAGNSKLEALLKEIEEHEHCDANANHNCHRDASIHETVRDKTSVGWHVGCAEGHRCCAEIAKRRHQV